MLSNSAKSASVVNLLKAGAKANTAAATGTGVDVSAYEGDIMVSQTVGVITAGTLDGKLQACSDAGGTGAADITGATFVQVTTANDDPNVQKIWIEAGSMPEGKPFLRYIGTIVTGPVDMAVVMHARPKYI